MNWSKNAQDADASEVVIAFRRVTTEAGEIDISDDGHGMSLETLLKRWMEPAASTQVRQWSAGDLDAAVGFWVRRVWGVLRLTSLLAIWRS